MSRGFLAISAKGWVYMAGFTGLFSYLSKAFTGPEHPKFSVDREIVYLAKETQPGIVPEHYIRK